MHYGGLILKTEVNKLLLTGRDVALLMHINVAIGVEFENKIPPSDTELGSICKQHDP